jgi:hypothetical protein
MPLHFECVTVLVQECDASGHGCPEYIFDGPRDEASAIDVEEIFEGPIDSDNPTSAVKHEEAIG